LLIVVSHQAEEAATQRACEGVAVDLERDRALFSDSRLYRQAEETAETLLLNLQVPVPLDDAVSCLRGEGIELTFRPDDLGRPIGVLQDAIERSIDSISPYHAIPALFRAVASLDAPRPAAAGTFKTLAIRLQLRVWTGEPGLSAARASLIRAVRLVYAERLLRTLRGAWAIQPAGRAELSPAGMSFDPETDQLIQAASRRVSGGGRQLRFSGETVHRMSTDPVPFLLSACSVLAGEAPSTRRALAGTYLAALPGASVARDYWLALAARLLLLETARRFARPVHHDPRGITIMGSSGSEIYGPAAKRLTARDLMMLQREMMACFWNRAWLADVQAGPAEAHAFVDRPVCRIDRNRELYVTSAHNIVDSITSLTEKAVGPYPWTTPYKLPQEVFERLVSKPFEAAVVRLLRQHGFVAGEVTGNGTWITQDGNMQKPQGMGRPHGQIDVLAWHPAGRVIVADCKVLQLPFSESASVNLWKKLHEDEQGFRGKLHKNASWAREFLSASGRRAGTIDVCLILDKPLHLGRQSGDVVVTDYQDLAGKLEKGQISLSSPATRTQ
jgi:hypothetical protein